VTFKDPIVLQKGQGLKSIITWSNTTDSSVRFGLQSTDEMGIIFWLLLLRRRAMSDER
jgi:hypothetical protein